MPTYEYRCGRCGEHLEVVQSFRDEPLSTCPSCGGELHKVFSPIGIVFKGSGFYRTDSRSAAKKGSGSGVGSAEAAGATQGRESKDGGGSAASGSGGEPSSATKAAAS
jgi:putative FmdB family regulatory protein